MHPFKAALLLLASVAQLASAWPLGGEHAQILTRAEQVDDEYDYIIIGGGTSGLVVGDRITAVSNYTVLVIEEGLYHSQTGMNPARMFDITSQPSPNLNNRTFSVGIGRAVGGSSCVNGQVFLRGTKEEYNAWQTLSGPNSTWNWDNLLPYFKKGITLTAPNARLTTDFNLSYSMDYWGTESKIYATFGARDPSPQTKVLYQAMSKMPGITVPVDSGAGETGLYYYTQSVDPVRYMRSYARTGHWDGINRPNYQMVVGAKVNRILFDESMTATGVTYKSKNGTDGVWTVKARREVILAAGSIHTPQILMLSGIGSPSHLKEAGIEAKIDLPGVGSNFQDHSYIPRVSYIFGNAPSGGTDAPGAGLNEGTPEANSFPPNLAAMVGLPVISPEKFEALASQFEAQDPGDYLPKHYTTAQIVGYRQQQRVFGKLMRSKQVTFLEMMLFGPGGSVQNLHPMSRGDVRLNVTNPEAEVIVDYRAASNPVDMAVMVEIIKFMRKYMASETFKPYEPTETAPGLNVTTDEGLADWARANIIPSVYHPVGTTAMMPREWGGVVDTDLRVYGTKKLRIVDGGMMPTLIGATTSMTVYAVAEKAADLIREQTFDKEIGVVKEG